MANQTYESPSNASTSDAIASKIDMKFEIVVIPVSDVDRAKKFYANLGWRLDADYDDGKGVRVLQFTPPGSACSVIFGKNVTAFLLTNSRTLSGPSPVSVSTSSDIRS